MVIVVVGKSPKDRVVVGPLPFMAYIFMAEINGGLDPITTYIHPGMILQVLVINRVTRGPYKWSCKLVPGMISPYL